MFGLRRIQLRRQQPTSGQLVRGELGEGLVHLRRAAGHAAGGLGATLGPRLGAVRGSARSDRVRRAAAHRWGSAMSALAPLSASASDAEQARTARDRQMMKLNKQVKGQGSRPRGQNRRMMGLLVVGAAVGTVAALRRRQRRRWDEYGTDDALEALAATAPVATEATPLSSTVGSAEAFTRSADTTGPAAGQVAEAVVDQADEAASADQAASGTVRTGRTRRTDGIS